MTKTNNTRKQKNKHKDKKTNGNTRTELIKRKKRDMEKS